MKSLILIGLVAVGLSLASGAEAAELPATPITLNIEAQPVEDALNQFAQQSGLQVLISSEDAPKGMQARRLVGEFTAAAALNELLEGTGLTYEYVNPNTIAIRSKGKPVVDASEPVALRMAQEAEAPQAPGSMDVGQSSQARGDEELTGRVTEASAGAPIVGALVRIAENGQTTSTDERGRFRFINIPEGEYTLSISYLGFAERLWRVGADGSTGSGNEFVLTRAEEIADVTVFGTRSARAKALNLQRTADNSSSVISADLLGNFTDATVADALRRASGVAFIRAGATGEGERLVIRGLDPDMSAVKLNGLHLPMANPGSRAPTVNTLLVGSIEKITIHESLLPSHDSEGTGGLVEIETKSPLSRAHRAADFSIEHGRKGGGFGEDLSISGMLSGTFGEARNIGISASVQHVSRTGNSYQYGFEMQRAGLYLPLDAFGTPDTIVSPDYIDPRIPFPYGGDARDLYPYQFGTGLSETDLKNNAYTLSGEWQVTDGTNLRLDAQRSDVTQSIFSRSLNVTFPTAYQLQSVEALGGEQRQALGWDGTAFVSQGYSLGLDDRTLTDTFSFQGNTTAGRWQHSYLAGYAHGTFTIPDSWNFGARFGEEGIFNVDPRWIDPRATDATEGRIISLFEPRAGRGVQLPLLTDGGWNALRSPADYHLTDGSKTASREFNDRYTSELTSRLNLEGRHIKYLELGASFENSRIKSSQDNLGIVAQRFVFDPDDPSGGSFVSPTLPAVGLGFTEADLGPIGFSGRGFQAISRDGAEAFIRNLPALSTGANAPLALYTDPQDPRKAHEALTENNLATYAQTRVDFGKLSFVGGVRMSRVEARSVHLTSPVVLLPGRVVDQEFEAEFTRLVTDEGVATDYLPRFQLNYRQTDNLIFRGSYALSVARPQVELLSQEQVITLDKSEFPGGGPNFDEPVMTVTQGNPALKPAFTHNMELGLEWYGQQIGLLKLNAFYKETENLLMFNQSALESSLEGIDLPDHPYFQDLPDNLHVFVQRPVNSDEKGLNWGASIAIERQFTFLPGFWSGLGFYGNFTYARGRMPQTFTWFTSPVYDDAGNLINLESRVLDVGPFRPVWRSGTAALTYSRNPVDATLTYSRQVNSQAGFEVHGFAVGGNGAETLDLRVEYRLNAWRGTYRVYFEGADLLRGPTDPDNLAEIGGTGGVPRFFTAGSYYGGRTLRLGVAASF